MNRPRNVSNPENTSASQSFFAAVRLNRASRSVKTTFALIMTTALIVPSVASGTALDPTARFSTKDADGDGVFEAFDTFASGSVVNPGLPSNGRIAHVEYDLTGFTGQQITSAILEFQMFTNNDYHQTRPIDDHDRTFDVNIYAGNGLADLDDADQTGNPTAATVTYHNTSENGKEFAVDLTSEASAILGTLDSSSYLGVSLVGLLTDGGSWGPSLWWGPGTDRTPRLTIETVPEPTIITLLLCGLASLALLRRRR